MKKKYLYLAAGMLAAASLGFVSCGDDDEDFHKNDKQEQKDEDEDTLLETALSSDGTEFNSGYVKINQSFTINPYVKEDGEWVIMKNWVMDDVSYDKTVVRIEQKKDADGKLVGFVVSGVKPVDLTTFSISYIYKGQRYTTEYTIQVLDKTADEKAEIEAAKQAKKRADLIAYLTQIRRNETPLDLRYVAAPMPSIIEGNNGEILFLRSKLENVSGTKEKQLFRPNDYKDSHLYPGCYVYINDKLKNGVLSPVTFNCENFQGRVTVKVQNALGNNVDNSVSGVLCQPDSIDAAVSKILKRLTQNGSVPAGRAFEKTSISNSKSQMSLDLDCSADFLVNVGVKMESSSSSQDIYSVKTFTQEYYTVSVFPEALQPVNYLGKDVTVDVFKQAEIEGKIGIIQSVTYGRYAYYTKKYTSKSFKLKASESLSFSKVKMDSKQDIETESSATEAYGEIIGGKAQAPFSSESEYETARESSIVFGYDSQGIPVTYEVAYLASGNPIGSTSTGQFREIKSYEPYRNKVQLNFTWDVSCAGDIAIGVSLPRFKIVNGEKQPLTPWTKSMTFKKDGDKWSELVTTESGVYFDYLAQVAMKWDNGVTGVHNGGAGEVDMSDGKLNMHVIGTFCVGTDPHFKNGDGYKYFENY